jgi:hypothetical protein
MDRTRQTPSQSHRSGPPPGTEALRRLVQLLAHQVARDVTAEEGRRRGVAGSCMEEAD